MNKALPILLVILAIGVFFAYIDPQYGTLQELRADEAEYREALAHAHELEELRTRLINQRDAISAEDHRRLRRLVPRQTDHLRLLNDVTAVGAKYGITITDVSVRQPQQSGSSGSVQRGDGSSAPALDTYHTLNITMSFETSYTNFKRFLRDLEQSLQIVDARSIELQPADGNTYYFTLTLATYSLEESEVSRDE